VRLAGAAAWAVVLLGACGGEKPSPAPAQQEAARPPADSLALTLPSGVEIWFTASRTATSAEGQGCIERVMEIRDGTTRRLIPLLYTGASPRLINDSTIEADIWLNCRPGNVYQVNVRSGQPVRVR
jgi:hypothetical protein